ncbi:dynein light chain Tctex-type protein 2 isoform 2-T2 [Pluvialis apricaria]
MEKRPKMPKPAAAGPEGGKRRQSLLDKDSMKGKRTQSNNEALGLAPVEEEYFGDSMKAKLSALKANRAKIRYANTYRLESHNKFRDYLVRDKAQAILTNKLQHAKYDGVSSPSLCASISEEILNAVKELDFDRYKHSSAFNSLASLRWS